ncbi:MAG TPA: putative quinol monooxygenase [Nitrososphaera sp.]
METTDIDKFRKRTHDAIRVLAFFKAKKYKGPELEKVLMSLVAPTRGEEGNISYVLHRRSGDPDSLMFDEIWTGSAALDEHMKKPYLVSLHEKIDHLIEEPPRIEVYSEV